MKRSYGILLSVTSLPSKHGIGTFGAEAYRFIDYLVAIGAKYWQVLPLSQTSYGDSPYQSPSAFAGNPYLIDLEILEKEGLLTKAEISKADLLCEDKSQVDYGKQFYNRYPLLRRAFSRFTVGDTYSAFVEDNKFWLDDYAVFMALKVANDYRSLYLFEKKYVLRNEPQLSEFIERSEREINFWKFLQYEFFKQYKALKAYANEKGVLIIGDMPIYVALDSSDVWAHPENFLLHRDLTPKLVAGVPPDYFSTTGQLWGNPIYDYKRMKKGGYVFWKERIKSALDLYDLLRIDHFRGFEAYYGVPPKEETAVHGKWYKGPNFDLFNELNKQTDLSSRILAEDLGVVTDGLEKMLKRTGFPGMKVVQFAFDGDEKNVYLPENCPKNSVCYTGTHDNDTTEGWYSKLDDSTKEYVDKKLKKRKNECIAQAMIRAVYASPSDIAIIPMQDVLKENTSSRMNMPSTITGNWRYRVTKKYDTEENIAKLNKLAKKYDRLA